MPTGLPQIQEGQISAAVLQQTCHTVSVGTLSVELCYDPAAQTITVTVTLMSVTIGRYVLDVNNASVSIGGSIDGFKAQVTIRVDWNRGVLTVSGELCAPVVGCTDIGPIEIPLVSVVYAAV